MHAHLTFTTLHYTYNITKVSKETLVSGTYLYAACTPDPRCTRLLASYTLLNNLPTITTHKQEHSTTHTLATNYLN
jgi:hypothetical protein